MSETVPPWRQILRIRCLLIFAVMVGVAGCTEFGWVDITGHHRGRSEARFDYGKCAAESGVAAAGSELTHDEKEADRARLAACMFSHGWRKRNFRSL